jgi:hypothetical protein
MRAAFTAEERKVSKPVTGAASVPDKLVYVAPRPGGVDQASFVRRWRQHGDLNMGFPYFERFSFYEQCATVGRGDEPELPGALFGPGALNDSYGGVGVAHFDGGAQTLADLDGDPDAPAARDDEHPTFGGPLGENMHVTHEKVIFDHGGTELRIFSFLHRREGLTLEEFSDQWRAFADIFLAHEELTRHCSSYVQDHVWEDDGAARFDGIAEMGFRSIQDVVAFVSEPTMVSELFKEEEPFIDRTHGVAILTRPALLLDRGRRGQTTAAAVEEAR